MSQNATYWIQVFCKVEIPSEIFTSEFVVLYIAWNQMQQNLLSRKKLYTECFSKVPPVFWKHEKFLKHFPEAH